MIVVMCCAVVDGRLTRAVARKAAAPQPNPNERRCNKTSRGNQKNSPAAVTTTTTVAIAITTVAAVTVVTTASVATTAAAAAATSAVITSFVASRHIERTKLRVG